ncbi:unnamed protein product [Paramecium octaurelia]|uniref:Uncharacterized protein n=1 Tax=Paramecium octaurelia TaxID=43137 RepID=A0A8S1WHN1_PAROT|nr:unnamed protein product [Paramecium octaurelia]
MNRNLKLGKNIKKQNQEKLRIFQEQNQLIFLRQLQDSLHMLMNRIRFTLIRQKIQKICQILNFSTHLNSVLFKVRMKSYLVVMIMNQQTVQLKVLFHLWIFKPKKILLVLKYLVQSNIQEHLSSIPTLAIISKPRKYCIKWSNRQLSKTLGFKVQNCLDLHQKRINYQQVLQQSPDGNFQHLVPMMEVQNFGQSLIKIFWLLLMNHVYSIILLIKQQLQRQWVHQIFEFRQIQLNILNETR